MRLGRTVAVLGCALANMQFARAENPDDVYSIHAALRSSLVIAREPDEPALFPERNTALGLWRFRVTGDLRPTESTSLQGAYEQRVSVSPGVGSLAGFGVLPSGTAAPYRIAQLDWSLASSSHYTWRHEIDRLAAAYKLLSLNVTIGRQAIGWGRGVMFSAVDLFAPFSPLEIDREWRRGIDAARVEATFGPKLSVDAIAAVGESIDTSAFVGRLRGYYGPADFELIGGWRARDVMAGIASSSAVGDAELHGELAVFRAPDPLPAGGQFDPQVAIKALLGGSYRFDVGNGVLLIVEYHYSGFGAAAARDVIPLLANPAFATRVTRGDTQVLGRHAIAAVATYEVSPELQLGLRWLQSPVDGSGVVTPTATATLSDRLAIVAAIYVPYGTGPTGLTLGSDYGATPLAGFVQLQASY